MLFPLKLFCRGIRIGMKHGRAGGRDTGKWRGCRKGRMEMGNRHDIRRDACQLFGGQAKRGYDWWWHSFTAHHAETGREKPFFVEFFLCNPALGGDKPVFGQLPENREKGIRPSYLMVKLGCWGEDGMQLHRFFGWNEVEVSMGVPFHVKAKDCELTETHVRASAEISPEAASAHPEWMCSPGAIEMDLNIHKEVAFHVGYGAGSLFRRLQLFEMFWHAEGMKSSFEGTITCNGERYIVSPETSYGYADKNWGKDFTSPWIWLSSNHLVSEITGKKLENSVFDIGGGRPKIGPVALNRKLLSAFWHEGRDYEFNFSKFWTFCRTKFHCGETDDRVLWHVEQKTLADRMVADISCEKKDMLLVNYEAPDGKKRHNRLWNGGNGTGTVSLYHHGKLVDRVRVLNTGCEYGEYCGEE